LSTLPMLSGTRHMTTESMLTCSHEATTSHRLNLKTQTTDLEPYG